MPDPRHAFLRLVLVVGVLLGAGCRYSGPYQETRDELKLTYSAAASTSIYKAEEEIGKYRFQRFEGEARAVLAGGEGLGLDASRRASSRDVVQPFSGGKLVLTPLSGGRVEMAHGKGPKAVLRFVTGSWDALANGQDVVMRLDEPSWQAWTRAMENAMLDLLDRYRKSAFDRLDADQTITEARVLDVLVDEKPLVRANRRELLVFFEPVKIEGGFQLSTRRKDPKYRWWSYELRPEVGDALASVMEGLVVVAIASVEVCVHCASRCR